VIQPVSPVVPSPSPVIAVQSASSPARVEVASGPLPEPTASDASKFRDAAAASTVEVSKVQEVTMQRLAPANQVWSHVSKNLSESMNGMSALEDAVKQSLRDYQKPSASKFADRSDRSSENLGTDGSSGSSSSGSSPSIGELSNTLQRTFQSSLVMMEFTITADLMSKSSQDTISSVKQLANGGGG
jgi:hypothetical protein